MRPLAAKHVGPAHAELPRDLCGRAVVQPVLLEGLPGHLVNLRANPGEGAPEQGLAPAALPGRVGLADGNPVEAGSATVDAHGRCAVAALRSEAVADDPEQPRAKPAAPPLVLSRPQPDGELAHRLVGDAFGGLQVEADPPEVVHDPGLEAGDVLPPHGLVVLCEESVQERGRRPRRERGTVSVGAFHRKAPSLHRGSITGPGVR